MRNLWFFVTKWSREDYNDEMYSWAYPSRDGEYKNFLRGRAVNRSKEESRIYARKYLSL
jgi:hypothetical protein